MNELTIYNNPAFGDIRSTIINNEPWFVGKDVATALGYKDTVNALKHHVDNEDKGGWRITTPSGEQLMTVINESGLYSLILSSKLPTAKDFKRWVTSEVLPSIRKHGAYLTEQKLEEVLLNPDTLIRLATQLKEEREKRKVLEAENKELLRVTSIQDGQLERIQPSKEFYDILCQNKSEYPITEIAKHFGWSAQAMHGFLHGQGIIQKVDGVWTLTQKYEDCGYTVEHQFNRPNGMVVRYMRWTQKGFLLIYRVMVRSGYLPIIESLGCKVG